MQKINRSTDLAAPHLCTARHQATHNLEHPHTRVFTHHTVEVLVTVMLHTFNGRLPSDAKSKQALQLCHLPVSGWFATALQ